MKEQQRRVDGNDCQIPTDSNAENDVKRGKSDRKSKPERPLSTATKWKGRSMCGRSKKVPV